jgi:hypothetical protein
VDVVRLHVAVRSEDARSFWRSVGARDFLTEAWIDLPRVEGPPDPGAPGRKSAEADDFSRAETAE